MQRREQRRPKPPPDDPSLFHAAFDQLPAALAVLDTGGQVVAVNASWRRARAREPAPAIAADVGTNYVAACTALAGTNWPAGRPIVAALRAVMSGASERTSADYERAGPAGPQRFYLQFSRLDAAGRVLVEHQDVTDRRRVEAALAKRLAFEQLLTAISARFINLAPEETDAGIYDALRQLGEFTQVDRSFVFVLSPDHTRIDRTHSWRAAGIESTGDTYTNLPAEVFPWLMARLVRGEVAHIPRLAELPPEAAAERQLLEATGVRSAVAVPMLLAGRLVGFVGFATELGEKAWSDESLTLLRVAGEMIANALARRDVDAARHDAETRLHRQSRALGELTRREALTAGDLRAALRAITETAAETLAVRRVGVWLISDDRTRLSCLEQYDAATHMHDAGTELLAADYPAYFVALEAERTIDAHDAMTDPRTREFARSYLLPVGITSMLDAPLRFGGRAIGVICHEHVGPPRHWTEDEQRFAGSMADLVSLAMESHERRRAEQEMAALLDVARDIGSTLELEELLDRVGRRAAGLLPCEAVATFYWDPVARVIRLVSHHGIPADAIPAAEFLSPSGSPFAATLMEGRTFLVNDAAEQPWMPPGLARDFRLRALCAAPLAVRGRTRGALVAFRDSPFEAGAVQLLEGIARQVAVAIETTELYRAQQEETAVLSALVRIGRELIEALDTPRLLDRLCQLTTEVLQCDCAATFVFKPEEDVWMPISGHNFPPEEWESLRLVRLPAATVEPLAAYLREHEVSHGVFDQPGSLVPRWLAMKYRVTAGLSVAFRRGGEVFGIHNAGYRGRREPFSALQLRIARGIGQLGSLALEHARVVEQLERANRLKSDFVATMSHELRTPLNVIMGYNDLVLDELLGPLNHDQKESLERIRKNARQLLDLINATLDLSRLEAGRVSLDIRSCDAAALVRELDAETRELQEGKRELTYRWEIGPDLPPLQTDPMKLKLVLKNLYANAVKFTPTGGVTVTAAARSSGVEFTIADTGIGMTPDVQRIIFEPFRQADSSTSRTYGGVGLGLYIVRRLLELLQGTVSVESIPMQGTTFRVWVPAEASPLLPRAIDPHA
jgi:signal transduction histidine kinase/transcriptional regulator with GAF, ATPase, and Fis domain